MSFRWAQARLEADLAATGHEPFRARGHIGAVAGLRGNTGMPHVLAKLVNKSGLVLLQIIQDSLHGIVVICIHLSADST